MTFQDLLTDYYLESMDKQVALSDWLRQRGNPDWGFTLDSGRLTFAPVADFAVQLLGTEAERSSTWLWAWANSGSNLPPRLVSASETLRAYGAEHDIPEFTSPDMDLDEWRHGHHICMVASGLLKANAYYRGPYSGGALFLLIQDTVYPAAPSREPSHILNHITQVVGQGIPVNLNRAIQSYLRQCGAETQTDGGKLSGTFADGSRIQIAFDDRGRVAQIGGTLKGKEQ